MRTVQPPPLRLVAHDARVRRRGGGRRRSGRRVPRAQDVNKAGAHRMGKMGHGSGSIAHASARRALSLRDVKREMQMDPSFVPQADSAGPSSSPHFDF
mmetsp:Transcript_41941/g.115716  ORF Transcript_41941/g.115716 Transcript_41941/m.115716 type:complete len:98 (+) Transcript_41941:265-558(+)